MLLAPIEANRVKDLLFFTNVIVKLLALASTNLVLNLAEVITNLAKPIGCPKKKSALGKHLEVAIRGFKLCILYGKREKLGSNPSRPFLGPP